MLQYMDIRVDDTKVTRATLKYSGLLPIIVGKETAKYCTEYGIRILAKTPKKEYCVVLYGKDVSSVKDTRNKIGTVDLDVTRPDRLGIEKV